MQEHLIHSSQGWLPVIGPVVGTLLKVGCINEGYQTIEIIQSNVQPSLNARGVSLTTKLYNYQESFVVMNTGETLYARVRGDQFGILMVGELR